MKDLFSKCGCNCGRCPSHKENLLTGEDRRRCAEGWALYIGYHPTPEKLRACVGCQAPDDENAVRYQSCYVRKCALRNGVETCAHCSAYPCEDVPRVSFAADQREKIAAHLGMPVPDEDYLAFIEPYEGIKHLDAIRASLAPEDIVEMTTVSVRPRIVAFPDDLPFSEEKAAPFEHLHRLLATAGVAEGVSYARQTVLKKRRRDLLKTLWAFGRFGGLREEGGSHLVVDGETYLAQKIQSNYSRVKEYFKVWEGHGVCCEHVPLTEEEWLTPTGALRKKGWFIKLSFADEAGGVSALKALQTYTARLHEEYGKRAFRYFSKADMRILGEVS